MAVYDVFDDIQRNIPPLQFHLGGRLLPVHGKMEICGAPGVFKSWLAQSLGFCFATGQPWLGFPTMQVRTLMAHFEMSYEVTHERMQAMSTIYNIEPMTLYGVNPGFLALDDDEGLARFIEMITPVDPRVIILDYLGCCFSGDENKSQDIAKLTRNLDILIREKNLSVILLHHTNKNPVYSAGMDKSSGHHSLPGWMDTVLYIARQPNNIIQIQFAKARHPRGGVPRSINTRFNNHAWEIIGGGNEVTE